MPRALVFACCFKPRLFQGVPHACAASKGPPQARIVQPPCSSRAARARGRGRGGRKRNRKTDLSEIYTLYFGHLVANNIVTPSRDRYKLIHMDPSGHCIFPN